MDPKRTVFVVDDEQDNLDLVRRCLSKFQVRGFLRPSEALAEAKKEQPLAFVVDYRMPEMTGVEFVDSLRAANLHNPALLVTAYLDLDEVAFGRQTDLFYQIIRKPFQPEYLSDWVELAVVKTKHALP